ncbi:uncharacterized protein LOC128870448 [Anastrepha ludens]|uniref:uncharacterized protein LOC128870448 n=1 Tax=Anastrepha ludens TaxID=28586 RepID=UPI0023B1757A|nr:uncharacterized protein LOC128870448 [Anastrepha ludens]
MALHIYGFYMTYFFLEYCQYHKQKREMIHDFLWPELDGIDLDNVYFQQDGATCHTSNKTIDLLREKFPGRVISRRGDHNWPPRSCDLKSRGFFFFWGHVKDKVYASSPGSIQDLKDGICEAIEGMGQPLCNSVMENFMKRILSCKRGRGGRLPDVIFHY